ncbi:hypothetical protein [Streptomyces sp. NPDC003032]
MSAEDKLTDFIVDLLHKAGVLNSLMDDEQASPIHDEVDSLIGANRAEILTKALTASERTFLAFALELAADAMASRGDEFTAEDDAALASLRRLAASYSSPAAGDKQPEPQTRQCGHDDYHTGHAWADQPHIWCPGHTFEAGER